MLATSSATSAGLRKRVGSVAAAAWLEEVEKAEVETVEFMAGNLGLESRQVWAEKPDASVSRLGETIKTAQSSG
jgi:predicted AAA+ superfamily ATPase